MSKTAIIIPCLNEDKTIKQVIENLKKDIPDAIICICDNNSSDDTVKMAEGASVFHQPIKGKGLCLRHLFKEVEADYYIMLDGDLTYDTKGIQENLSLMKSQRLDLLNFKRISKDNKSYKFGRKLGNTLYNKLFNRLFKTNCTDVLSGYKILNKNFINNIILKSEGFEIETELHIRACLHNAKVKEVSCDYYSRAKNSKSKLKFFNDGIKIVLFLFKEYYSTFKVKQDS